VPTLLSLFTFLFTDTATTALYTLSLHDALPILAVHDDDDMVLELHVVAPDVRRHVGDVDLVLAVGREVVLDDEAAPRAERKAFRSEEHTSELQSRENLVCRLLLDKKKHST